MSFPEKGRKGGQDLDLGDMEAWEVAVKKGKSIKWE
jgi:hypothetical protein